MEFGSLTTYKSIDSHFKKLQIQSRQQILKEIYKKSGKKFNQTSVEQDISETFGALLQAYDLEKSSPIVKEICYLFQLDLDQIRGKKQEERNKIICERIRYCVEAELKIREGREAEEQGFAENEQTNNPENHFEWIGVKSKYPKLRPIFQEILLEKVKMFDNELTQMTQYFDTFNSTMDLTTTARNSSSLGDNQDRREAGKLQQMRQNSFKRRKAQHKIQKEFCDVKIRDKSQFTLQRWSQNQQEDFQTKKAAFKSNLKINNVPVLFQFVKKYTSTVKARDNIYRKWQEREKIGITPEELRYLCATSVFLNKTLAKSQKIRIKNNVKSAGKQLISKLQLNIAQKIIQTYKTFMKKVSDLRAKYYEQLTEKRKLQYRQTKRTQEQHKNIAKKREKYLKYKKMFKTIVESERMSLKLNPKIQRWVKLFVRNIKNKIKKKPIKSMSMNVIKRLAGKANENNLLYKLKLKYPSSRIIKRQDQYSHRLKYHTYIPSQRFEYDKCFQNSIQQSNKMKLGNTHRITYQKYFTGGPKVQKDYIIVDLIKKKIKISSTACLKAVIRIQAKWKALYTRKRYLQIVENNREVQKIDFQRKVNSLARLYPQGRHVSLANIRSRLERVNMKISNLLHPYIRVYRKALNNYTSFCVSKLSVGELKNKHGRNGRIRLAQFNKMVKQNTYGLLKKSGIVVTSKEINEVGDGGASAMWWSVYHSNVQLARTFLQGGGDPNSRDQQDNTCLHVAMKNGDVQIIFLLLDYGADLNRKNAKRFTPLYFATNKMLKLLGLEEGYATVSHSDSFRDNNALFYRRGNNNEDVYHEHLF